MISPDMRRFSPLSGGKSAYRSVQIPRASSLDDGLDLLDDPLPEVRKLRRYLGEFSGYITNNAGFIPNYAERHRYGEAVSTAFVESAVNQVIAKRFAKKLQSRWTPRGVHLLCNCAPASSTAPSIAISSAGATSGHHRRARRKWRRDTPMFSCSR